MTADTNEDLSLAVKVLRSQKRADTYLYLPEQDVYEELPEALQKHFGEAIEFLNFSLHANKKLAQVDAKKVMQGLAEQGYFLQLPPSTQPVPQPEKDAQLDVTPSKASADDTTRNFPA